MSLLMTSQPIVINRDLACRIGLNEAIVLQQLHYWLNETNSGTEHGGIRWVYNTTEQWLEQFPFWSESTLKRTFASLKSLGVLRREQLNKSKRDMTNFYTINYESELLEEVKVNESIRSKCTSPSGQSDLMDGRKMTRSIGSKRHAVIGSKWPNDLTENTTEITTENKTSSRPDASQPDTQTAEQEFLTRHPDAVVFSPKKRQWGTQDDLTCAQWLWKKSSPCTSRPPNVTARWFVPKNRTGQPGKRNSPDVCAGWSYPQTNLRDVQPRQPRSVLVP